MHDHTFVVHHKLLVKVATNFHSLWLINGGIDKFFYALQSKTVHINFGLNSVYSPEREIGWVHIWAMDIIKLVLNYGWIYKHPLTFKHNH